EMAYREHFRIDDNELVALPESMEATLTAQDSVGRSTYELSFADPSALPARVLPIAEVADPDDPVLVGVVTIDELIAGATVATAVEGLPKVRFRKVRDITAAAFWWAEWSVMKLALPLLGVLALWLGVVKIAEEGGLVNIFVRMIRPVLGRLFPEIPKDHPALGMIALNLGANVLGLGNAATPMGIKAMHEMQKLNNRPDTATNSMCMFLSMNTASVMLVPPATLVGIMGVATGQLWVPIVIVTGLSLLIAIVACRSLQALPVFRSSDPALAVGPPPDAEGEAKVEQADDAKGGA
ncbi:MAG: nucleoside recognition domain-containing protein, partial [Planctomycetota bacterium]